MTTSAAAVEHRNPLAEGGILDRIIAETRLTPDDEAYDLVIAVASGEADLPRITDTLRRW